MFTQIRDLYLGQLISQFLDKLVNSNTLGKFTNLQDISGVIFPGLTTGKSADPEVKAQHYWIKIPRSVPDPVVFINRQ
jgi:hypothetical protein